MKRKAKPRIEEFEIEADFQGFLTALRCRVINLPTHQRVCLQLGNPAKNDWLDLEFIYANQLGACHIVTSEPNSSIVVDKLSPRLAVRVVEVTPQGLGKVFAIRPTIAIGWEKLYWHIKPANIF
jgi:hypothetical protein